MAGRAQLFLGKVTQVHTSHCWIFGAALNSGNLRGKITSWKIFFLLDFSRKSSPKSTYGFVEVRLLEGGTLAQKHTRLRPRLFCVWLYMRLCF